MIRLLAGLTLAAVAIAASATSAGAAGLPTVTGVAPSTGPLAGGTTVTITGTNFVAPLITSVKFGSAPAQSYTVNSETSITAVSPAQAAGTVDVTVSTAVSTSATSPADQFTYEPPIVSGVSPSCGGPPAGGSTVTITGAYFKDVSAVRFGSAEAASFAVNSETSITAVSPPGTGTVDVTVSTPAATSATSSADRLMYFALTGGGTAAVGWGGDRAGQLGVGFWDTSQEGEPKPGPVVGLSNIAAVSSSYHLSLLLLGDGTVWAAGGNDFGQLGIGTRETPEEERAKPVQVSGLCGVTAISGPGRMALQSNGTVMTWGSGRFGGLGNGTGSTHIDALVPQEVPGLRHVVALAAGGESKFALLEDGTVMAWGSNANGKLGIGVDAGPVEGGPEQCIGEALEGATPKTACSQYPRPVAKTWPSGVTVSAISSGNEAAYALLSNGTVMAWGNNGKGALGTGPANTGDSASPEQVPNLTNVVAVSGFYRHVLAVLGTGQVVGWGIANAGEIGPQSNLEVCTQNELCVREPRPVSGLENVTAISAGRAFSLALSAGTVFAFGSNEPWSQLGIGSSGGHTSTPTPIFNEGLGPVSAISAGWEHSLAILQSGSGPAPLLSATPQPQALRITWTYSATSRFELRWKPTSGGGLTTVHLGPSCSAAAPCSYTIGNLSHVPYEVILKGEKQIPGTTKYEVETDRKLEATPLG